MILLTVIPGHKVRAHPVRQLPGGHLRAVPIKEDQVRAVPAVPATLHRQVHLQEAAGLQVAAPTKAVLQIAVDHHSPEAEAAAAVEAAEEAAVEAAVAAAVVPDADIKRLLHTS